MFIILNALSKGKTYKTLVRVESIQRANASVDEETTEIFLEDEYTCREIKVLETLEVIKDKIRIEVEFHERLRNPVH